MAFNRFRPISHFIAPHSWSNDPCGAIYIPETEEYILCYQWNPGTSDVGNSAWGMARSKDLVTWEDCAPAIKNGTTYDCLGVFSGSIISKLVEGRRVLFLFYTSISALPIHWSKEYIEGCESQSVALSSDFGRSWSRYEKNPLLRIPPKGPGTTGWRDPFVSKWEALSSLLDNNSETDYMMLASGERGHGPELHLYQSSNLLEWQEVSTLLDVKSRARISSSSDLNYGMNFECASFFSFGKRQYIIVGIEEDKDSQRHCQRSLQWLCGNLILEEGKPQFKMESHGLLDHGIAYAAHIFRDKEGRLIQLGWADEDCQKSVIILEQGWAGCLAHPRELFEVSRPTSGEGRENHIWNVDEATGTMTTLGIRPAPQVAGLRAETKLYTLADFKSIQSTNFEFKVTFSSLSSNEIFAFNVRESPHSAEFTKIIFSIKENLITIDRSHSSLETLGIATSDSGPFQLLPDEDLRIHAFADNSIIEVYANDRFALTSRVYPSLATSTGVSYDFGEYDLGDVKFECWEGMRDAWPGRKMDEKAINEVKDAYFRSEIKEKTDGLQLSELTREETVLA